jgi:hypothetical protein
MKQFYDTQARDADNDNVRKGFFSTVSQVHRAVAGYHTELANFADQRIRELG